MSHFKAKIHRIDFGWDSAPDPAGGAYSASQTSSSDLRPTSNGKQGRAFDSFSRFMALYKFVCMYERRRKGPRQALSFVSHTYIQIYIAINRENESKALPCFPLEVGLRSDEEVWEEL